MGAAIALRDGVGKAQHRLVIGVGPLHRDFENDPVALAADRDRRRMQRLLRAVEIVDERFEPAIVMKAGAFRLGLAQIGQHQRHAAVQEGQLAQPVLERCKIEFGLGEGRGARQKGNLGAGRQPLAARAGRPGRRRAKLGERRLGVVRVDDLA